MRLLLALSALLASAPTWAQVRAVPVQIPSLSGGAAVAGVPSLSPLAGVSPALSAAGSVPTLSVSALPVLPASALSVAPSPLPVFSAAATPVGLPSFAPLVPSAAVPFAPVSAADRARPVVLHSFRELARYLQDSPEAASEVFDGAAPAAPLADPTGTAPTVPPGVREVVVYPVRRASDIEGVIPRTGNSEAMIKGLRWSLDKMIPFDLHIYRDFLGGSFVGVDLSKNPANAARIPEMQPHELKLVKKIMAFTNDLQVLVREEGKTPDLMVGGLPTEMKSLFPKGELALQLTHANEQVHKHAQRHGLGLGAIAVDLINRETVPDHMDAEIAAWAKMTEVSVSKIHLFADTELRTFVRDADGTFRRDESGKPFGATTRERPLPIESSEVRRVQLLTKAGRLEEARRYLARAGGRIGAGDGLDRAAERLEAERVLRRIGKLVQKKGLLQRAEALWQEFRATRPAVVVHMIEERVRKYLPLTIVPAALQNAPPLDAVTFMREATEPPKILAARGIKATITVYGSARIKSPAEAQTPAEIENSKYYEIARRFGELVALHGGGEIALVTGGGPGIMEAANRGAFEAGGPSVGYNIKLTHEQGLNGFVTPGLEFEFENFATRKMALRHGAMALTYFPGGFGTMDELFEVLTLMQTGKMPRVPIVLIGEKSYWEKILDFEEFSRLGLISPGDLSLFKFAETAQAAWDAIADAHKPRP